MIPRYSFHYSQITTPAGIVPLAAGNADRVAFIFSIQPNNSTKQILIGGGGNQFAFKPITRCDTHTLTRQNIGDVLSGTISLNNTAVATPNISFYDIWADPDCWPPDECIDGCLKSRTVVVPAVPGSISQFAMEGNPTRIFLHLAFIASGTTDMAWSITTFPNVLAFNGLRFFNDGVFALRFCDIGPLIREPVWIGGNATAGGHCAVTETYY